MLKLKSKSGLLVLISVALCMLTFSMPVFAYASPTVQSSSSQQVSNGQIDSLINAIPQYLTQQQYEKFVSVTSGDLKSSLSLLLLGSNSKQNKQNNIGLWDINDYKLLKYKQIPNSQVPSDFVHYQDYSNYNDVVTYYASLDIAAKQENMDIFSGINYFLWVFGKDSAGDYKLLQWSQPIIQEMQDSKLTYNDGTEDLQRDIQNARKNGIALNGKEEIINSNTITPATSYPPGSDPIKPTIRVYRVSLNRIDTVDFYSNSNNTSYVRNVLPNEWNNTGSDPMQSLETGAMCVKMYGWYHQYYYKYYGLGYDVKDTIADQVYIPGTQNDRSTSAINAVGGIGIENSSGSLFETQYLDSGPTQYSGKVSNTGADSLANSGYSWFNICAYYYNYSDKSSGAISSFTY